MDEKSHDDYCSSPGTDIEAKEENSKDCLTEKGVMNPEGQEKQSQQPQHKQQAVVGVKIDKEMSNEPNIMKSADRQEEHVQIKEGLQQLMRVLKSPDSPERQIQIFNIFVNHKPLIGAFYDQEQALFNKLPVNPNASKYEIQIFQIFKSNPSLFPIWSMQRMNELDIGTERLFEKIRAGLYTEEYLARKRQVLNSMKKLVNQCRQCEYLINERYHCTVCDNFNLCPTCYEKVGHPHEMEKLLDKPPQETSESSSQNENEIISTAVKDVILKYELDRFVYNCSKCKSRLETSYHCTTCNDFALCLSCKEKVSHPHEMEKIVLNLDDESSPTGTKPAMSEEARNLMIHRCTKSLVHACECKNTNCKLASCQRMSKVVQHIKTCKKRTSGGCPICMQVVSLCCYHARHCKETKCPVPFCFNIRQKFKQKPQYQRLQQALLLKQRMAVLNTRPMEPIVSIVERMKPGTDLIQTFKQHQHHQQPFKIQSLKRKITEMNMVPSESNSTSTPKACCHENLPSISSNSDDINEVTTSQQGHHSKVKPNLQKCVSFKKRGLLVRSQKRKFNTLAKQSIADLRSSVAFSDVSAMVQFPTAKNADFEMTTPQENNQLIEVKQLLDTLNKKVTLLTDTHQQQYNELKNMIQVVDEKIDNLLQ